MPRTGVGARHTPVPTASPASPPPPPRESTPLAASPPRPAAPPAHAALTFDLPSGPAAHALGVSCRARGGHRPAACCAAGHSSLGTTCHGERGACGNGAGRVAPSPACAQARPSPTPPGSARPASAPRPPTPSRTPSVLGSLPPRSRPPRAPRLLPLPRDCRGTRENLRCPRAFTADGNALARSRAGCF